MFVHCDILSCCYVDFDGCSPCRRFFTSQLYTRAISGVMVKEKEWYFLTAIIACDCYAVFVSLSRCGSSGTRNVCAIVWTKIFLLNLAVKYYYIVHNLKQLYTPSITPTVLVTSYNILTLDSTCNEMSKAINLITNILETSTLLITSTKLQHKQSKLWK